MKHAQHKVIFVVGPTASGKSNLALHLAQKYKGSIVNIDSVQFYKGLSVGSAAPSENDKKIVPHYLYSYVAAPQEMTAGQYIRDFYQLLEKTELTSPVFIVGGTGFYIQALEKGMFDLPETPEDIKKQVIDELEKNGIQPLWQELKSFDETTPLHQNDHYRVCRAIEVKRAFGKKMSELSQLNTGNKYQFPFSYMKIGMTFSAEDKERFRMRVYNRTLKMLDDGIIDEVQLFLNQGFDNWAPLHSVGYAEVVQFLRGEVRQAELAELITQATMKLVKKQKTWFKRDGSILWSDVFATDYVLIEKKVQDFLTGE